ncbi:hypothetical protein B9K03_10015 [Rothia sp. Olga]|nr:hypothetical protein B9K03_10015 [Rothia sp. Olga]
MALILAERRRSGKQSYWQQVDLLVLLRLGRLVVRMITILRQLTNCKFATRKHYINKKSSSMSN